MKRKPIRVDWDELEVAFSNHDEELIYYLDTVTGHVVLEGEGQEADFDDEDDYQHASAQPTTPVAPREDATRANVEPISTELKLQWMGEFLAGTDDLDADVAGKLREAVDSEEPAPALTDVLREHADVRDRWYLYRSDRLRQVLKEWLSRHGVEPIDPPPWE